MNPATARLSAALAPPALQHSRLAMALRPHILVVNGRKVRQPVFVIGAPHSGADLLGSVLKRSAGFHVTIGQPSVASIVHAFARSPSIQRGRGEAAAAVLRDAFAQAWQVDPESCRACSPACRDAGGVTGAGSCVADRDIVRYGDASPDLMYCAAALLDAFSDARIVQIIRDGRDVVAAMLADADVLAWFRPGVATVEREFPHPFFGIETDADLAAWAGLSLTAKCAMRWRGSVREMARLRTSLAAEQLATFRYEQLIGDPAAAARAISAFLGTEVRAAAIREHVRDRDRGRDQGRGPAVLPVGGWRRALSPQQVLEVEQLTGAELRRVGYSGSA
jgi:Sulfotransferase family